MTVFERVFAQAVLQQAPPVLVDVGATGGILPAWQKIARYSIGLGFEPDRREIATLAPAQRKFLQWIFSGQIVVADPDAREAQLHLTKMPVCSSTLPPNAAELARWSFGDAFTVTGTAKVPAATLEAVLAENALKQLDWLKCDTQGTDLRIFQSLPVERRRRVLVLELEPGIMDAYLGEDKFHEVLKAMEAEPFSLIKLDVQGVPRGNLSALRERMGARWALLYSRLGGPSPGWANVVYLRRFAKDDDLGYREYLLGWAFAHLLEQPAYAWEIAEIGREKFSEPLFDELAAVSIQAMRRTIWRSYARWPGIFWRALFSG